MDDAVLGRFTPQVAGWFTDVFAHPTDVQKAAWDAISAGSNALVVAPTGSGKTLAAFLWALNELVEKPGHGSSAPSVAIDSSGVSVIYISPLKALGVDVERNLTVPLTGIARVAARLGKLAPNITIAVRSGDTPARERTRQIKNPPDILITTPESFYLMLTGQAAGILTSATTVIIDEIHALAGTKRGVHLALSLERLERLAGHPIQRIGLSATVRPLEAVAGFLGGDRPVTVIAPETLKEWDLTVHVPVEDMSDLPTREMDTSTGDEVDEVFNPNEFLDDEDTTNFPAPTSADSALPVQNSIWPFIEEAVYKEICQARSTLIFVNSRRSAERLTSRINELWAAEHHPETLSPATRRPPAQLMAASAVAGSAPPVIARAHHGSVSKEERAHIEQQLKTGELKSVVATSSLELGIDMGAVDLVIQVESPPSVAGAIQRVGRAGHVVGGVSRGSFYPKHRGDLVQTVVEVERMRAGAIEKLTLPTNALDVLVQQTIAQSVNGEITADDWYACVRRAYPYRNLSRDVFDAVLDLASGMYPSTDFAELRPRIVYDRVSGMINARPGAQRVAVTSGGTIPDRGMFGVFLVGAGEGDAPRRVGELDEEMVYECRVGDVFTLGATSWRIEEITRDQVLVTPAPGHTGRLPFWNGDQPGRPAELGEALGAFRREVIANPERLTGNADVDQWAKDNLLAYLSDQEDQTGIVPDEKTLLLERFKDEVGDWRVVLHSCYGRGVNAPWALAVGARIAERTGMDVQAQAGDDGIVLRLPDSAMEPSQEMFLFDADEIESIVTNEVGGSALFASRFRECAARALLLPRYHPGKRAPLWQQRQRAAQLLDVARKYPSFPIILETVRECLQDVYDLPALTKLCRDLTSRQVRIAEITTDQPSPFASSLLFNYTGAFMYEGDSPLAEKRAAALALDPALLMKLLGTAELRDLFDPDIVADIDAQLRRVADGRRARTPEEMTDVLRLVGPIAVDEMNDHADFPDPYARTMALGPGRVMTVRIAGVEHLALAADAALLRDGLGIPVPAGVAASPVTIHDALPQLVSRFMKSRGPVTAGFVAQAFGLGVATATTVLQSLSALKTVTEGHFRQGVDEIEYCASAVLTMIRRRCLAAAKKQSQPVSHSSYGRFLTDWHQIAPVGVRPTLRGVDGVYSVIEQLAGVRLPASALESVIFPARVDNYSPMMLDELTNSGEVTIVGAGSAGQRDPWIMLLPRDYGAQLAPPVDRAGLTPLQEAILHVLDQGGGFFFPELSAQVDKHSSPVELQDAMWALLERGLVSPDGFDPIRARLAGGTAAHRNKRRPSRNRLRLGRTSFTQSRDTHTTPLDMTGRWAVAVQPAADATTRSVAQGEAWLDRYGIVTKGAVTAEDVIGGFALAYKVLSGFEEKGKAMRGYFIDGLGAAQFSAPAVIDRLRAVADTPDVSGWPSGTEEPVTFVLAATDPANPYGAALPWPQSATRPSRSAGALVIITDGLCLGFLTRGGKNLTLFTGENSMCPLTPEEQVALLVRALSTMVSDGRMTAMTVENINGQTIFDSDLIKAMRDAGAQLTPKGVKIGGPSHRPQPKNGRTAIQAITAMQLDNVLEDDGCVPPPGTEDFGPRRSKGGRGARR